MVKAFGKRFPQPFALLVMEKATVTVDWWHIGDVIGSSKDEEFFGRHVLDHMFGEGGDDRMWGHGGDDMLNGGAGNDKLIGGRGNDYLGGKTGNDSLSGDEGNDSVHGDEGNDYLQGGYGNDLIYGWEDDDTLAGGAGNDTLCGGHGVDLITGGLGNDEFELTKGDGHAIITDFNSGDDIIPIESDWTYGSTFGRGIEETAIFDGSGDLLAVLQRFKPSDLIRHTWGGRLILDGI